MLKKMGIDNSGLEFLTIITAVFAQELYSCLCIMVSGSRSEFDPPKEFEILGELGGISCPPFYQ